MVLDLDLTTMQRWACRLANRDLTAAEWRELAGPLPQPRICPLDQGEDRTPPDRLLAHRAPISGPPLAERPRAVKSQRINFASGTLVACEPTPERSRR
jgi:hypothetical protein